MTELEKQLSKALTEQSAQFEQRFNALTSKVADLTEQLANGSRQVSTLSGQVEDLTELLTSLGDKLGSLKPPSPSPSQPRSPAGR